MSIAIDKAISAFNTLTGEKLGKAQADLLRSLVVAAQRYEAPAEPAAPVESKTAPEGSMDVYLVIAGRSVVEQIDRATNAAHNYAGERSNVLLMGRGALHQLNMEMEANKWMTIEAESKVAYFCDMRLILVREMDGFLPIYDPALDISKS